MKKLLLLLLALPVFGFSQFTVTQEVLEEGPFQVGDVITVRYQIQDNNVNPADVSLLMFDVNYNNRKVLITGDPIWGAGLDGQLVSRNHWNNFSFTPNPNIDIEDLHAQHDSGGGSYSTALNWNLLRFTAQSTQDIDGLVVRQKFTIQDPDPDYYDYTDAIRINWARIDQRDISPQVTENIVGDPRVLNINAINYTPAGNVSFKVELPDYTHATDYVVVVEPLEQYQNRETSGQPIEIIQGNLDISGNFTTTQLKQDVPYIVNVFIE